MNPRQPLWTILTTYDFSMDQHVFRSYYIRRRCSLSRKAGKGEGQASTLDFFSPLLLCFWMYE